MKRPHQPTRLPDINGTRDPRLDLDEKQLAAFALAVLYYNILEDAVTGLLSTAQQFAKPNEIKRRIYKVRDKVEAVLKVVERIVSEPCDLVRIRDALAYFTFLQGYRNVLAHARIINASVGIGLSDEKNGRREEILLSVDALVILQAHFIWTERELSTANSLLCGIDQFNMLAPADPRRAKHQEYVDAYRHVFYENGDTRRRLAPLLDFPSEETLAAAGEAYRAAQRAKLSEWMQPFKGPVKRFIFGEGPVTAPI
jgi:hypothetical protein